MNVGENRQTVNPIYPSVNPNAYKNEGYSPTIPPNTGSQLPQTQSKVVGDQKSPTISQIMRDFDLK